MGAYSEYLDAQPDFEQLSTERKRQLARLSELRGGRDVLVFAADLSKVQAPITIDYPDLLPISDQLANLQGRHGLDLILESPGGSGEVAEDIVRLLHDRYDEVAVIVPGYAKSAGTIMAMAGDEILMGAISALGPIDAQLLWQGKIFSAGALLEGMEKIKKEVEETGTLNRAYIPMLQAISPGELQSAENALDFAKILVRDWLAQYKFKNWDEHRDGRPVTTEEKSARAAEIADVLCNHRKWLTHRRSLRIPDLEAMGLRITDYSQTPELDDAITRYYTLLQMTFASSMYKLFETPESQIYRFIAPQIPAPAGPLPLGDASVAIIEAKCGRCAQQSKIQANLGQSQPLQEGCLPFPSDNKLKCPSCSAEMDLSEARRQLEAQVKKPVVAEEGE